MGVAVILALAGQLLNCEPATAAPTGARPAAEAVSYPPEFFAAARPNTAFDMIQRLPGFQFDGGGGVRGLAGGGGNVLIDGARPASKSDSLEAVLRRLPAAQVARIEVIRGGASGLDADGRSVVANVIRRADAGFRGVVTVRGGRVLERGSPEARLTIEARHGNPSRVLEGSLDLGYAAGGEGRYSDRVDRDAAGAVLAASRQRGGRSARDVTATSALETAGFGGGLRLNGRLRRSLTSRSERELFAGTGAARLGGDEVATDEAEAGLRWRRALVEGVALDIVLLPRWSRTRSDSLSEAGGLVSRFHSDSRLLETIARSTVRAKVGPALSLEGGLEGVRNVLEGEAALLINGAPSPIPGSDIRVEEQRGEAFVSGVWQARPSLVVEGGLRFEASRLEADDVRQDLAFAKPYVALAWSPTALRQIRLRAEHTVGQLDFYDFLARATLGTGVVTAGARRLTPTRTTGFEAVIEQRFWGQGALVAKLRHEELADVIDLAPIGKPPSVFDAPANIGDATRNSASLDLTVPLDRMAVPGGLLKLGLGMTRSRVRDPATGRDRRLSWETPVSWSVRFTQDLPARNLAWGLEAYGGAEAAAYRLDAVQRSAGGPYAIVYVEHRPRPDLTLRLQLNNAVARRNRNDRDVYPAGRAAGPATLFERREEATYRTLELSLRKALD